MLTRSLRVAPTNSELPIEAYRMSRSGASLSFEQATMPACSRSVAISGCLLLAEYRFGIPTVLRDGRSMLYDDKTLLGGAASTTDQAASQPW